MQDPTPPKLPIRFDEFVLSHLGQPPAAVLEVGCGRGELARALAGAGYAVTAIDPDAPEGTIFLRVPLEELADPGPFDAIVASVSLHHIENVGGALCKIARLLRSGGVVIVKEFAREQFEGATARWYYHQRQALAAAGAKAPLRADLEEWLREWAEEHSGIHTFAAVKVELDRRFVERALVWTPYLFSYELDESLEPLEKKLIETGGIQATGIYYAGERP